MYSPETGNSRDLSADAKEFIRNTSGQLSRIPWGSELIRRTLDRFGSRKFSDTAWRTSFEVGLLSVVSGGNVVLTVIASASALMAVASSMAEDAHHGKQPF